MRDDRLRIEDIRDAIERIQKYSNRGRLAFDESELVTAGSCTTWRSSARRVAGFHVHQYFGIDYEAVWAVVEHDLPALQQKIDRILAG